MHVAGTIQVFPGCKFNINITTLSNVPNESSLLWFIRPSKNTSSGMKSGCPVQRGQTSCYVTAVDPNSVAPGITIADMDEFALYDPYSRIVYATANVDGPGTTGRTSQPNAYSVYKGSDGMYGYD